MNIWGKLLTALRGGVNEAGEKALDHQALRILDQELRDAANELNSAKRSLVDIMAQQKTAEQRRMTLAEEIAGYERYALQALDKGEQALAQEVAEKIAALEAQSSEQAMLTDGYRRSAEQLRSTIHTTEQNLRRLRQQADTVRATESVQRAQKTVAERFGGSQSKLHSAMASLERIQERQAHESARFAATAELATDRQDSALTQKLQAAGIKTDHRGGDAVLARLKAKRSQYEQPDQ